MDNGNVRKQKYQHLLTFEPLIKAIYCVQPTSAAVERAFSVAGHIYNKKRMRLGSERLDKLIFLNKFISFLEHDIFRSEKEVVDFYANKIALLDE